MERTYCKGCNTAGTTICAHCISEMCPSLDVARMPLRNYSCAHPSLKGVKLIDCRKMLCDNIKTPSWCPLLQPQVQPPLLPPSVVTVENVSIKKPKRLQLSNWEAERIIKEKYDGGTKFEDIKVGDIIHIPKVLYTKGGRYKVTQKLRYSIECERVNGDYTAYQTLYDTSYLIKLITVIKHADN